MPEKIGFARVSTAEQSLNEQIEALEAAGCKKVFHGKQSGLSKSNQEKLDRLVDYIREGDTVIVYRLDRLGRSLKSILHTIEQIHEKGANLRTLDGVIDTSLNNPISKAMVSLIGVFAQLERDLIFDRTSEGRERAKAEGKHMGRPPKLSTDERISIRKSLISSTATVSGLAKKYNVARQTIMRIRDGK
ncbi:MAG: recombinase family protein [Alteromonadaceae bacterium TMED7]|nr:resolvase [Alteromonadaceae bacterium]RPH15325.1 MAG: recombinase family protein [Alteromonadaceae bacterium TMED7]|tara:strand:+ start:13593 stop:14159 length:567 start_codon:yes stop_codon:yes gene_type:complete